MRLIYVIHECKGKEHLIGDARVFEDVFVGELRLWHCIYVRSIESSLTMRVICIYNIESRLILRVIYVYSIESRLIMRVIYGHLIGDALVFEDVFVRVGFVGDAVAHGADGVVAATRVQGAGFRVQGSGFRVQGLRFRV